MSQPTPGSPAPRMYSSSGCRTRTAYTALVLVSLEHLHVSVSLKAAGPATSHSQYALVDACLHMNSPLQSHVNGSSHRSTVHCSFPASRLQSRAPGAVDFVQRHESPSFIHDVADGRAVVVRRNGDGSSGNTNPAREVMRRERVTKRTKVVKEPMVCRVAVEEQGIPAGGTELLQTTGFCRHPVNTKTWRSRRAARREQRSDLGCSSWMHCDLT